MALSPRQQAFDVHDDVALAAAAVAEVADRVRVVAGPRAIASIASAKASLNRG